MSQPIDKGRVSVVAEKYPATDQNNQQVMKNRYATVGRATLWPSENGSMAPNIQIDIDTMPMGISSPVKLYVFWDSDNQNNQSAPPQQQAPNQQQPAGAYQQQNYQPQR